MSNYQIKTTPYGTFKIDLNDGVQAKIGSGCLWDDFLIPIYQQYLKPDSTFVDAGAFIGSHSIFCSTLCQQVYSFEPQPPIFDLLCENIKLSNRANIKAYNYALSNKETKMKIKETEGNSAASFYLVESSKGNIKAITLDSLKLKNIGLIKIDCEGEDYNVILGAKETIKKYKPIIVFEIISTGPASKGYSYKDFDHFFYCLDYKVNSLFGSSADYIATPN